MSQPIVRMYASVEHAKAAVARLSNWGFEDSIINLVTASSTPPANAPRGAASDDPVLSSVMAGYVLKAHAKVYAEGIRRGKALVSITPPFGRGTMAEFLLDEGGQTVDTGLVLEEDRLMPWDDATPLSCALRLPVLVKGTAPLSAFLVAPVLTRQSRSLGSALGIPELSSSPFIFGAPALSRESAVLSSKLGLPVLWK